MKKNKIKKAIALYLSTALVSMNCLNVSAVNYKKILNRTICTAATGLTLALGTYFLYNRFVSRNSDINRDDVENINQNDAQPVIFEKVPSLDSKEGLKIIRSSDHNDEKISCKLTKLSKKDKDGSTLFGTRQDFEEYIKKHPEECFRQDKETGMCYVKVDNELHEAGRFTISTLGELSKNQGDSKSKKKGKFVVVYEKPSEKGMELLDFNTILDSGKFDLISLSSDPDCIARYNDFESTDSLCDFKRYYPSGIFAKCPWTTLCLLYMPGLNGMAYNKKTKELERNRIDLLDQYELPKSNTTQTFFKENELREDKKEYNDKYKVMLIENAPIALEFEQGSYKYIKEDKKIDMLLDAKPKCYCKDSEQHKMYLKRKFLSLFNYCKQRHTEMANVFIGIESMNAKELEKRMQNYKEVLEDHEVVETMKESGTTYIMNARYNSKLAVKFGEKAIDLSNKDSLDEFDKLK